MNSPSISSINTFTGAFATNFRFGSIAADQRAQSWYPVSVGQPTFMTGYQRPASAEIRNPQTSVPPAASR